MVAATRNAVRQHGSVRRAAWQVGLWSAALLLQQVRTPALAQPADEGIFITVPKPITSSVKDYIKAKTSRALGRNILTIIYDFSPPRPAGTDDYGSCRDLAAYLATVQANTVAFVHGDVTGHRVLPVLACKEVVMSKNAILGNALADQAEPLADDQRQFYRIIAERWGRSQAALVLKMLDRNMEVIKAKTLQGTDYYLDKAEEPPQDVRPTGREPVVLAKDAPGLYAALRARDEFHLCKLILDTREDVRDAYRLLPSSLREDPLEGRDPKSIRFLVNQRINASLAESLKRRIRQAVGEHFNVVILQLEGGGGETQVAQDLAVYLRDLADEDEQGRFPVQTIAYIPKRAPDAAAVLALGCTDIVMEKDAEIGDFEKVYKPHGTELDPDEYKMVREALVGLAQQQGYSPLVARGMLDRSLWIYEVRSQRGQSGWKLVTKGELEADQKGPKEWGKSALIKPGGEEGMFLKLDAELAKRVGLARHVVTDFDQLKAIYDLKKVADAKFDFLYKLASFLKLPIVSVFLIMIGIACLILELKMPGIGLPGVIAALCFVLYFWAQSQQLSGQIIMLAILLFVLGLLLLALEIFVVPGFGVPGISGIVLVLVSLALATLEKKPETYQEWLSFGKALGAIGISLAGAVTVAFAVARYLPSIPYANRLVLKPPFEATDTLEGDELPSASEGVQPETVALLGAIGVAATTLRPAGIALFGDDFVDVVTEGNYVQAGQRVQVIEIEGNRVVVKEV